MENVGLHKEQVSTLVKILTVTGAKQDLHAPELNIRVQEGC